MSEKIDCPEHGDQEAAYVCCHLAESLETGGRIGFYYASGPRADAWCAACEEVRLREGGETGDWNDRSESFANIKLLCGTCYDKIRIINGI